MFINIFSHSALPNDPLSFYTGIFVFTDWCALILTIYYLKVLLTVRLSTL